MSLWFTAHEVLIKTTLIYVLLAFSFQVVLRSGLFSFASVGFFGLGGYGSASLTLHGMPGPLALLLSVAGCLVLSILLALLLSRLRGLYLALSTVAFDLILGVVATNSGSVTGGPVGLFGVPATVSTAVLAVIVIVTIVLLSRLEHGPIGRSFELLRLNEDLALSVGIEVRRRRMVVFCISAVLGALAGGLDVFTFRTINPQTAGFALITTGLTMAVLGGIARWPGAVIGALIVVWLPSVISAIGDYRNVVDGTIIVLIVVFAPTGIVGLAQRGWTAVRRRRRGDGPGRSPDHPVFGHAPADVAPKPAATGGQAL
jgi:branched-chain amino acid transport system permease protein